MAIRKALVRFTRSASTGAIIHGDPNSRHERARYPDVPEADLADFEEAGLISDSDGGVPKSARTAREQEQIEADAGAGQVRTDLDAERSVAAVSGIADEAGDATALDHRNITHYDPAQRVGSAEAGFDESGAQLTADREVVTDPDAAPIESEPVRRTATTRRARTEKSDS